jgi:uncharacterized membrane protein
MNSLTKMQVLMAGFLLLVMGAFLVDIALLVLAAILFILQLLVSKRELRADYPEDWVKYSFIFLIYEVILLGVLYLMISSKNQFSMEFISTLFIAALFVIILTILLKFLVVRKSCYGTVIFSTGKWVGVQIKSDLFTKIKQANYAVENPLELKVKKGDRVSVRMKSGMNACPSELLDIVK